MSFNQDAYIDEAREEGDWAPTSPKPEIMKLREKGFHLRSTLPSKYKGVGPAELGFVDIFLLHGVHNTSTFRERGDKRQREIKAGPFGEGFFISLCFSLFAQYPPLPSAP